MEITQHMTRTEIIDGINEILAGADYRQAYLIYVFSQSLTKGNAAKEPEAPAAEATEAGELQSL